MSDPQTAPAASVCANPECLDGRIFDNPSVIDSEIICPDCHGTGKFPDLPAPVAGSESQECEGLHAPKCIVLPGEGYYWRCTKCHKVLTDYDVEQADSGRAVTAPEVADEAKCACHHLISRHEDEPPYPCHDCGCTTFQAAPAPANAPDGEQAIPSGDLGGEEFPFPAYQWIDETQDWMKEGGQESHRYYLPYLGRCTVDNSDTRKYKWRAEIHLDRIYGLSEIDSKEAAMRWCQLRTSQLLKEALNDISPNTRPAPTDELRAKAEREIAELLEPNENDGISCCDYAVNGREYWLEIHGTATGTEWRAKDGEDVACTALTLLEAIRKLQSLQQQEAKDE